MAGTQETRSANDSDDQDPGTPLPLNARVISNFEGRSEVAEVRLPAVDDRQPLDPGARGVKTVNFQSESAIHSSFAKGASSPTSSLRSSPASLSFSGQFAVKDNLRLPLVDRHNTSSVSPGSNQQKAVREESDSPVYKNNLSPDKESSHLRASLTGTLPRSLQSQGGDLRDKDIAAAEKATQQQEGQRDKGDYQGSGASPPTNHLTLPQSKPSIVFTTPLFDDKPAVKLPRQHLMSSSNVKPVERPMDPHGQPSSNYRRDTDLLRSLHRSSNRSSYAPAQAEWKNWQELTVRISDLPLSATTRDLWRCFSGQGTITMIEFYENQEGQREGKASVRFRYVRGYSYGFVSH